MVIHTLFLAAFAARIVVVGVKIGSILTVSGTFSDFRCVGFPRFRTFGNALGWPSKLAQECALCDGAFTGSIVTL